MKKWPKGIKAYYGDNQSFEYWFGSYMAIYPSTSPAGRGCRAGKRGCVYYKSLQSPNSHCCIMHMLVIQIASSLLDSLPPRVRLFYLSVGWLVGRSIGLSLRYLKRPRKVYLHAPITLYKLISKRHVYV